MQCIYSMYHIDFHFCFLLLFSLVANALKRVKANIIMGLF